jgi:hypothetical protein
LLFVCSDWIDAYKQSTSAFDFHTDRPDDERATTSGVSERKRSRRGVVDQRHPHPQPRRGSERPNPAHERARKRESDSGKAVHCSAAQSLACAKLCCAALCCVAVAHRVRTNERRKGGARREDGGSRAATAPRRRRRERERESMVRRIVSRCALAGSSVIG